MVTDMETTLTEVERGDRIWWNYEDQHTANESYVMEVRGGVIKVTPERDFFYTSAKRRSYWLDRSAIKIIEVEKGAAKRA